MKAGSAFLFFIFLFVLLSGPLFAKTSKEQEKSLLEKGQELSYEGQIDYAKSLLKEDGREKSHSKSSQKKADEDDGFAGMFLSMLWGSIGAGFFIYGKKQAHALFLLCGIALCVFPFFVSDVLASAVAGLILCVAPFKIKI